jgi:hypothetical protein
MSIFDKLAEKIPTEQQTADYLRGLEQRTGVKAERISALAERAAVTAVGGLKAIEDRASRLEGFVERVNARVEGRESPAKAPGDKS